MIDEAEIREMHGVRAVSGAEIDGWADAKEFNQYVVVGVRGHELKLTTHAARRLAAMLKRCARRVEDRQPKP